MSFSYNKSPEELREAFLRQVGHLRRSAEAYDAGHIEEAERLAGAIYTLFFDGTSKSKSASQLAGVKQALRFPDSRFPPESDPGTLRIGPPLCVIGTGGVYWHRNQSLKGDGANADPRNYPRVQFSKWWAQTVYTTDRGKELTRMNLVFAMRHQDGGGHVDNTLKNEAYHWLSAYGDMRIGEYGGANGEAQFVIYCGGRSKNLVTTAYFEKGTAVIATDARSPPPDAKPIRNAHWASMRQMAWEADLALKEAGF